MAACGTSNETNQKESENNNDASVEESENKNINDSAEESNKDATASNVEINENTKIEDSMTEEELKEIAISVLSANVKYGETEELDKYMNTLSSRFDSPESIASLEEQFHAFDLDYELLNVEVQSVTHEEAVVVVTQKTVATQITKGYQFNNHTVDATHTLVNENGYYKFYSTVIDEESIVFLDENGKPQQ